MEVQVTLASGNRAVEWLAFPYLTVGICDTVIYNKKYMFDFFLLFLAQSS